MTDGFGGSNSLGSASGDITLDASGALSALRSFSDGLQNVQRQSDSFGKGLLSWADQNSKSLTTLGTGLAGIGAGILASFGIATKVGADFDAQISAVGSVAGATQEQLSALREEALRLGADTTFSASEAASGMEIMLKAGASLESVLNGGTEAVLNLSAATGVDVPLAAETAATAMNTFGVSAEEAADTIAQSANASALDVNDWALALKSVGPVASSLGLTMDDLAAAMVILGDSGIKGEVGATALRNILLGIADPASEGAIALNEWGVATHDASGNMRSLEDITHDLAGSWGDMSQAQQIALAEQIAGKDGVAAFMAIMDAQTEAVKNNGDAFDDASERMDATGTASEQAAKRMDNLKGSWEQLMGTVETAMITFTSGLAPALRKVVDGVNKLLQRVLKLPSPVKTAVAAFAGIAGILGVVSGGFLLMLPRIAETVQAFRALGGLSGILGGLGSSFGLLLSPIGLVAIAAGLLAFVFRDQIAAAVKAVTKTIGEITDVFATFREQGLSPVDAALAALQLVFPKLGSVIGPIRQMVDNLADAFRAFRDGDYGAAFDAILAAIRNAGAALGNLTGMLVDWTLTVGTPRLAGWIVDVAQDVWGGIKSLAGWAWDNRAEIGDVVLDLAWKIADGVQNVWDWLKGWIWGDGGSSGLAGDGTGGAAYGHSVPLGDVVVSIGQWLRDTGWPNVQDFLKAEIGDPLRHSVDLMLDVDNLSIGGIKDFEDAVAGIKADWERIKSFVEWIRDADLSMGGIQDFGDAVAGIKADWQRIRSFAGWFTDTFTIGIGIQDFQDAVEGLKNDWQRAKDAASWFVNDADFTMGGISDFADAVEGIKNDWEAIKGAALFVKNLFGNGGSDSLTDEQEDVQYGGQGGGGTTQGTAPLGGGTGATGGPTRYADFTNFAAGALMARQAIDAMNEAASAAGVSFGTFATDATASLMQIGSAATQHLTPVPALAGNAASSLVGTLIPAFSTTASSAGSNFAQIAGSATANFSTMHSTAAGQAAGMRSAVVSSIATMAGSAAGSFAGMTANARSAGAEVASAISTGTANAANAAGGNLGRLAGIVANAGYAAAGNARSAGSAIGEGLASGIDAMYNRVAEAGARLANAAAEAIALAAQVHSPSRVTMRLGEFFGEGFELGILSMVRDVRKAIAALVNVPGLTTGAYGTSLYGARIPAAVYAGTGGSHITNVSYTTTVLTIPPDEWVRVARDAETAPQRTIRQLEEDYARMGVPP